MKTTRRTIKCACPICRCDKRVYARKAGGPVCAYCLADTHRVHPDGTIYR